MARRFIHYEAAFEDYVRSQGWPYVPVDEAKKAIFAGARVKSFDFIVYPPGRAAWLVDVKGRKFPYETRGGRHYWENWVTRDDLRGLRSWKSVFGTSFDSVFVFVYWLKGISGAVNFPAVHLFRGESYAFVYAVASEYAARARNRSTKWDTISVPLRCFRDIVNPVCAGG